MAWLGICPHQISFPVHCLRENKVGYPAQILCRLSFWIKVLNPLRIYYSSWDLNHYLLFHHQCFCIAFLWLSFRVLNSLQGCYFLGCFIFSERETSVMSEKTSFSYPKFKLSIMGLRFELKGGFQVYRGILWCWWEAFSCDFLPFPTCLYRRQTTSAKVSSGFTGSPKLSSACAASSYYRWGFF